MHEETETILAPDGLRLSWALSAPPGAEAGLLALHGFGLHRGRLGLLGKFLDERGLAFASFDLRGHGDSEGIAGHLPSFRALVGDLGAAFAEARRRLPALRWYGFGQGLGALPLIARLVEPDCGLAGAILQAPLLGFGTAWSPWRRSAAGLLAPVFSRTRLGTGLRVSDLSSEPCAQSSLRRDARVQWRASAGWYATVEEAQEALLDYSAEIVLPVLVQAGTRDAVVRKRRIFDFASRVGPGCVLRWYPKARHVLLEEQESASVLEHLWEWLQARL